MPLIKNTAPSKKVLFKAKIESNIQKQINDYCSWAGVNDPAVFLSEAALFLFKSDKEWKKHLKESSKASLSEVGSES